MIFFAASRIGWWLPNTIGRFLGEGWSKVGYTPPGVATGSTTSAAEGPLYSDTGTLDLGDTGGDARTFDWGSRDLLWTLCTGNSGESTDDSGTPGGGGDTLALAGEIEAWAPAARVELEPRDLRLTDTTCDLFSTDRDLCSDVILVQPVLPEQVQLLLQSA